MNPKYPKYLKIELGKLYVVALRYPAPEIVNGFSGKECRWILVSGQALYTPEALADRIAAFKPGQPFTIQKIRDGQGIEWKIGTPEQPGKQPAASILDAQPSLDSPVDEISHSRLEDALRNAVSAAAAAEKHGAAIGYPVRFKPEDVRAMAISVLIGMDRRAA